MRGIFSIAEDLLASQEGFWSSELLSWATWLFSYLVTYMDTHTETHTQRHTHKQHSNLISFFFSSVQVNK